MLSLLFLLPLVYAAAFPTKPPPVLADKGHQGVLADVWAAAANSWTTVQGVPGAYPLSDATFRPQKKTSGNPYTYEDAPDGTFSIKSHYENGSLTLNKDKPGGFSFYALGPTAVDLTTAKEATLTYSVFFQDGFEWQKGGKLPGFFGGDNDTISMTCSGGSRLTECFSFRLMWRRDGAGEVYAYVPPYTEDGFEINEKLCDLPGSVCDPLFGISIERGAYDYTAGAWTTITERVKLNDAGEANGEVELFVSGESVILATGIIIRDSSAGRLRGIQMQTFFGGSDDTWASPQDQDAYFTDFTVTITETF